MMTEPEIRKLRETIRENGAFAREHGFPDDAEASTAAVNALDVVLGEQVETVG